MKLIREMCSNGNATALSELLSKNTALPQLDIPDSNGETPLFLAVKYSHSDIVKVLLKHNCAVNIQDAHKNYPIHIACRNSNVKMGKLSEFDEMN